MSLAQLPVELIDKIVTHFESARTLLYLALTCKRLHSYVEKDGWRALVLGLFPSFQIPPYWKDGAHALTTLSRAWDSKGFVARFIFPENDVTCLPVQRKAPNNGRQRGQTMGYKPVIDCFEDFSRNSWAARREVLAWGAGAELIVRVKTMGKDAVKTWYTSNYKERGLGYDQYRHRYGWIKYKENDRVDGRDDITSMNILRPWQRLAEPSDRTEQIIIGRESGELVCVSLSPKSSSYGILAGCVTGDRSVDATHMSPSTEPILAAGLWGGTAAVYRLQPGNLSTKSFVEIKIREQQETVWTIRFLSESLLAVGNGLSKSPIHVYDIGKANTTTKPLRKFFCQKESETSNPYLKSAVFSIASLSPSSVTSSSPSQVFLSGWYDGSTRLHDLRTPSDHTAIYTDPIVINSAVYSLLPIACERVVVGSARDSVIKVFDLRMPGERVYNYTTIQDKQPMSHISPNSLDYSIYVAAPNPRYTPPSPVYALSSGAPHSPHFYAGLEGKVVQLDVVNIHDKHPDQAFGGKKWREHGRSSGERLRNRYDPQNRVFGLAGYQHASSRLEIHHQMDLWIGGKRSGELSADRGNWDERWNLT